MPTLLLYYVGEGADHATENQRSERTSAQNAGASTPLPTLAASRPKAVFVQA